jgi:hypothetical protein
VDKNAGYLVLLEPSKLQTNGTDIRTFPLAFEHVKVLAWCTITSTISKFCGSWSSRFLALKLQLIAVFKKTPNTIKMFSLLWKVQKLRAKSQLRLLGNCEDQDSKRTCAEEGDVYSPAGGKT